MKFLIVILLFIVGCNNKHNLQNNVKEELDTISEEVYYETANNAYLRSIKVLDSIVDNGLPYDDFSGMKSIEILTEISGYVGHGNHNYFGTFGFKDEDLIYWKDWFNENKDSLNYLFHIQSPLEYALNIDRYYVVKIDSMGDFYLIYLKKANNYYKVVSEKIENTDKCEKIKNGDYLSINLKSVFPDTSKISYKVDGINYKGTEFDFERDSILDIYETDELIGLCRIKK